MSAAEPHELTTLAEIASMLGVTPAAVSNWHARHGDFPRPWGEWGGVRLFLVSEVLDWYDARQSSTIVAREARIARLRAQLARLEARQASSEDDRSTL